MVDTNLTGLLHTGRAFIDDLLAAAAEGRPADLVHVGSIGGHTVFPAYAVYGAATKAAVAALTRGLRAELGPRGVRVRAVEPGITESELGDGMLDAEGRAASPSSSARSPRSRRETWPRRSPGRRPRRPGSTWLS